MMDKKVKAKWLKALRSGKYRQGVGLLYAGGRYCCLGVLCVVIGKKIDDIRSVGLPSNVAIKIGLRYSTESRLATMNDAGKTFREIADNIEKTL